MWVSSVFAVTAVDSGSKALEFLGLNDEVEQSDIAEAPSVSPNNHHQVLHSWVVSFWGCFLAYYYLWVYSFNLSISDSIALPLPTGSRCEFDHYRLLHARNDRL